MVFNNQLGIKSRQDFILFKKKSRYDKNTKHERFILKLIWQDHQVVYEHAKFIVFVHQI